MASEFYGLFDSTNGEERSYDAEELATVFRALSGAGGVAKLGTNLQVTAEGGTMRTLVAPGLAMLQGYGYELQDDGGAVTAFTHPASAASPRCDRIVLRLNLDPDVNTIAVALVTGTPAADPQPPALTRTATMYEVSLARVLVRASAEEIATTDVTDERADTTVCGLLVTDDLRQTLRLTDADVDEVLQS